MKKLLLHVCCAPCSTSVVEMLENYDITFFFYNPNIEPIDEYEKRLKDVEDYAKKLEIPLIIGDHDNADWHSAVKGFEKEPENGKRCDMCFMQRLKKTADAAGDFDLFTTTLSVSPYKDAEKINALGKSISDKFLSADFKKRGGYLRSIELSRKNNLYRQKYCGCLFSGP